VTGLKNDGLVFLTGNSATNSSLTQFDFYNPLTNSWSVGKLSQSFNGTFYASVISANNSVYLAGGISGDECNTIYHDKVFMLNW
jgi:hypothetical protein